MQTLEDTKEIEAWDAYTRNTGVVHRPLPRSHRAPKRSSAFPIRRILLGFMVLAIGGAWVNVSSIPRSTPAQAAAPVPAGLIAMPQWPVTKTEKLNSNDSDQRGNGGNTKDGPQYTPRDGGVMPVKPPKPAPPKSAVPTSTDRIEKVIAFALAQQGKPYRWAQAGPRGFDCSGLVLAAFAQVGVKLPHYTGTMIRYGAKVSKSQLKRGDIIFPTSGHVAIYLGNGQQIAASSGKGRVVVQPVYGFYAARRLL